jgi:hypothetical protein
MAGLTKIQSGGIGDDIDFDGEGTLILDSTNNRVGIGTSSPIRPLSVSNGGAEGFEFGPGDTSGTNLTLHYNRSTSAYIGSLNQAQYHTWSAGGASEKMRIDSIGRLILNNTTVHGTSSRSSYYSLLHINGNSYANTSDGRITLTSDATLSGTAAIGSIYFADLNGGDRAAIRAHQEGAGNSSDNFPGRLSFWTNSGTSNATEKMRIDSAGRVGIGSGSQDLSTFNANGSQDLVVYSRGTSGLGAHAGITLLGQSTTASQCSITFADGNGGAQRYAGSIDYFHSNDSMSFRTGSVGSRMVIDSSGNVGIGTTSPTEKLHVAGNAILKGTNSYIGLQNASGTSTGYIQGQSGFLVIAGGSGSSNTIAFYPQNTEAMRIDSSGNLQVSTGQFTVGTTASTGLQFINDGTFGTINSIPLVFRTVSAERMRLANSGELLLGTTTAPARGELLKVEKKSAGTEGAGIKLSGTYSLPDDGSQTFTVGNCALIFIAENNTGDGAMFFCTYKASAVSKVSDPHDRYANSDTDGKICVYKTAESQSVVLKNRCGATKSFTIGKINTSD